MNLTDFLPDIRLEIRGCPEAVMLNHLRHALREFCRDGAGVWAEDLEPITPQASLTEYDVWVPNGAEAVLILTALYNDEPIGVYTPEEMDTEVAGWRAETAAEVKAVVPLQKAKVSTVRLYPIQTQAGYTVNLRAALQPTLDATTCHDDLGIWTEKIAAGAIARLKKLPEKPWTDRESVAHYYSEFRGGVDEAAARVAVGPMRKPLRTKRVSKA